MTLTLVQPVPQIGKLPNTLPREGAVNLEVVEGAVVLRVSQITQERIEELLEKQKMTKLSASEETELDEYESIDDYLSFLNRLTRNLTQTQLQELPRAS